MFGRDPASNITNLVNNSGVVASDVSGVGTVRRDGAASNYGDDKAIYAYGNDDSAGNVSFSNLVNNSGVVQSDVTGVGTARVGMAAVSYGGGKAVFAYGAGLTNEQNHVNTSGVIAATISGVGTARSNLAGAGNQ